MRFHVRVDRKAYLRCQLEIAAAGSPPATAWFDHEQMALLMSALEAELPLRLPRLLPPPHPPPPPEIVRTASLQLCFSFVPNATRCWLLAPPEAQRAAYTPLPYTLLLHAEPFDAAAAGMRSAPPHAVAAPRPIEGYFAAK
ncbi:hypothetical protein AB1Y20_013623 [Prymnesium parvum]|uniref:Uncharacterized protein n=1 Tax=Prymnesium parvum TaxID=97485 RepID=A0AB34IIF0_PRYPA